jgi:hypothetical protein
LSLNALMIMIIDDYLKREEKWQKMKC